MAVIVSGAGVWNPPYVITNEELVSAYNAYAEADNQAHAAAIEAGERAPTPTSSAAFIEKASGIKARYAYVKDGILDLDRMYPRIEKRPDEELSHQAEMALHAAEAALADAGKTPADIDMVIVSCAYTERSYPAIAIEVQDALGIQGMGFDMLVACSAATFGLQRAHDAVAAGSARAVLCINPELTSPQVNYRDRDSHFIFGDVATAMVLENDATAAPGKGFEVLGLRAVTQFSNHIRSNFGYVARAEGGDPYSTDRLFHQEGRKVFKEVVPMAVEHLLAQLESVDRTPADIRRWWLHQANLNMNQLITRKLIGEDPTTDRAPTVLDEYANTASAGSIIAFAKHRDDFEAGDVGVLCSFGAGYSIGSLVLRKR
ncbi:MAG: beta-ketoacyl-ACP synthase III [Myxococcota bacterium]